MITRCRLLLAGGAAVSAAVTGVAAGNAGNDLDSDLSSQAVSSRGGRKRFPVVRVERDRIIRTVAGLRPFRPSGFQIESEGVGGN
jgi:hypothetical protein